MTAEGAVFAIDGSCVAGLSDDDIIRLIFTQADQLPMEFAREAVSRGGRIVPALAEAARLPCNWHRSDAGWCAVVHAVFLMGEISGVAVIEPLMDALRLAEEYENPWVSEALPAIFGRLGPRTLRGLRALALDPCSDFMLITAALEAMAAVALSSPQSADEVFGFIGGVAADEKEDQAVRAWAGSILLDCARRDHEDLLRRLADSGIAKALFGRRTIRKGMQVPHLVHYQCDWMQFYQPDEILERRRRRERGRLSEEQAWRTVTSAEWGAEPGTAEPCDHRSPPRKASNGWEGACHAVAGRAERRRALEAAVASNRGRIQPHLQACAELSDFFIETREFEAAAALCQEIVRRDPEDRLRCRYSLLIALAALDRFPELEAVLDLPAYRDDPRLDWPWMRALSAFAREGASPEAERHLSEALGRNSHLPNYLLGRKELPDELPRSFGPASVKEAQFHAPAMLLAWEHAPGALRWLAVSRGPLEPRQVGRNELCPCGSGKKFKKCCLDRIAGHA